MKTNQVMIRPMGQFEVEQRTKDGFFNATELLKQWNEASGQQKQISHYTDNASTKEFLTALLTEENLKERNSVVLQSRDGLSSIQPKSPLSSRYIFDAINVRI